MAKPTVDDDADDWKNTPAKKLPRKKIPLDEAHECPMCLGKGFVHVVNEPKRLNK